MISTSPKLSLVIPTMGSPSSLMGMMDSIIYQAPASLLALTEIVVFLNIPPDKKIDTSLIENYLSNHKSLFCSTRLIKADKFCMTAEESAFSAVSYATGEYIWISGDKRIFLPEGLAQLAKFIETPQTSCAYFNSVWYDDQGKTQAHSSSYFNQVSCTLPYKQFVQRNGINFIATGMGLWIFHSKHLDLSIWQKVIRECGPHFSHVTTLLATLKETNITCYAVFLSIIEKKAYHTGNGNEWAGYAKLAGTYRYYAWTLGLVRQFQFLIDQEIYSYPDVRRSMCCEGAFLGRQLDEIYKYTVSQIWYGWLTRKERMKQNEFEEILSFLVRACPERTITNRMMSRLYKNSIGQTCKSFVRDTLIARIAIDADQHETLLSSLIIGQIGDQFIRLHPDGYVLSNVSDNVDFTLAYRVVDASKETNSWQIIDDLKLTEISCKTTAMRLKGLHPIFDKNTSADLEKNKKSFRSIVKKFVSPSVAYKIADYAPKWLISLMWNNRL